MLFLYTFLAHFFPPLPFNPLYFFNVAENFMVIQKILLWIQWMHISILILMLDSQAGQVEG